MVILGIDTSHVEGGVCLDDGISPPTCARFGATSSHLVELGFCVDRVLGERRMQPADITRIALVEGPGSFTGLRIGMAYAKGLAAALDVEIVTVGTLELLSLPFLRPDPGSTVSTSDDTGKESAVCAMVDARKGEIYGAVYARPRDGSGNHGLPPGLAELLRGGWGGDLPPVPGPGPVRIHGPHTEGVSWRCLPVHGFFLLP